MELEQHCPQCGERRFTHYFDKIFCLNCEWEGKKTDLIDDFHQNVKDRKKKLKKLKIKK